MGSKVSKFLGVPLLALMWVFVLALGAFAGDGVVNTSVSDFRVNLDRTEVSVGSSVNVVVELLNENGEVDVFAESGVDYAYVDVGTVIGTINGPAENGTNVDAWGSFAADTMKVAVKNGVARFHITYNTPGEDTLRVQVFVKDVDGDYLALPAKLIPITVHPAPNQAAGLLLVSIEPDNPGGDNVGAEYANSTTNSTGNVAKIDAGQPFTMKVLACANLNCTTSANTTLYQNGEFTIYFVPQGASDCEGVVTVTGEMQNGVALVHVPAGTLTKAGNYTIYMSGESTLGEIHEVQTGTLTVDPLGPARVQAALDFNYMDNDKSNAGSPTLTVTLVDQYGNPADTDEVTSPVEVQVSSNYKVLAGTDTATITINNGTNTATFSDFRLDAPLAATAFSNGMVTATLSFSAPYEVTPSSLELTIYQKGLLVIGHNATYTAGQTLANAILVGLVDNATDNTFTLKSSNSSIANATVAGNFTNATAWCDEAYTLEIVTNGTSTNATLKCGTTVVSTATGVGTSWDVFGDGSLVIDLDNTTNATVTFQADSALLNKSVVVELYDNGTKVGEVTSRIVGIGVVDLRYNKAFTGDGGEYYVVRWGSTGTQYMPDRSDNFTISVNPAEAYRIAVYKEKTADYNACIGRGSDRTDVSAGIESTYSGAPVSFEFWNNATAPAGDYVVVVEDAYGNVKTGETIYVDALEGVATLNATSMDNGEAVKATFNSVGNDTLEFAVSIPGVDPVQVPVRVVESAKLSRIEVLPGREYALTNGQIPLLIKAYDENGDPIAWNSGTFTLLVSNPSAVKIYDKTGTTEYHHGDVLPASTATGELVLIVEVQNTPGDVEFTVRNTSGSVADTATVHIVRSVNDIPASVASVAFEPTSVSVQPEGTVSATLRVTDSEGNGLSGRTCTLSTDAENVAAPATDTVQTGADGEVPVEIQAGTIEGTAHITATCEGVTGSLTVTVSAQPVCSSDNLTACTTQSDCEAAGGVWENGTCVAPQPAEECSSDNLTACTTQTDCENAGGYWYDGACHAEPQQMGGAAAPAEPIAQTYTLDNPATEPVTSLTISGEDKSAVTLVPEMVVPADRQGQTATLYYLVCASDGSWCGDLGSLGETTLGEVVSFPILSEPVDLSGLTGCYDVYIGFAANPDLSDVVYTYYEVCLE
ncbi:Ig-like domain-containing protein [Thermosulfurimonas sp. F29]|uniref:Ig-like domain-containing protein n=1 Tax=Thermosulfurimonas sp. F29 TaxID=2867247 RepID=UPI001C82F59F|nr:Ig-like domain-containing protein [Thermosulfurimonas sp. F29]MBX6424254.1 Ig-like domain-containing protein [Thermosulfurimonas sp. F29]